MTALANPAERDRALRGILSRLRFYVNRGRKRYDDPDCRHCGRHVAPSAGPLCAICTELFDVLVARFPDPLPRQELRPGIFEEWSDPAPAATTYEGGHHTSSSERHEWLPYSDE